MRLQPGESRVVTLAVDGRSAAQPLSVYDASRHAWVPATGTWRVFVGASSADVQLQGTVVVG